MLIELQDLKVVYGKRIALDGVNLSVEEGATGLLGPNGAGKSTLIKTLLGFLTPLSGSASAFGMPTTSNPREIRRRIGYMPENDCHLPGLNAVSFVAYCGELSGMRRVDALQRAHEVLYYVGLEEARYRNVETYSTGMRQRIKLAQALVHDPRVLFLDEPTNGLDPKGREEMLSLIAEISTRLGMSTLLSSHLLSDVERICPNVIVLNQGRVVTQGAIEDLRAIQGRMVEIRIKGDRAAFLEVLEKQGCRPMASQNEMIRVALPEGWIPMKLFQMAQAVDVQIRHLVPVRYTLEDIFMHSIEGGEHADL